MSPSHELTAPEIAERLPVWTALSELFLDTSFDASDFDRIAATLEQSPYDAVRIEQILRTDVSPAFSWNLLQLAGEWCCWDQAEVCEIVMNLIERQSGTGLPATIRRKFSPAVIPREWPSIAKRLSA